MEVVSAAAKTAVAVVVALALLGARGDANAVVMLTDPDDGSVFLDLYRPTGEFDETALSGFEFLISSRAGVFRANDQYLISGEATEQTTSIANDLGAVGDLSGTPFTFSIQHNLSGGRNFTFSLTHELTSETSVLCWGENCAPGSHSTEILNGIPPIDDYNGLQIQVRAQEVAGSSASVTITSLIGVDVAGADFFDEVVTPDSPGTISPFDRGRRGQWMLGDSLDLVVNEWELTGLVILSRPDLALEDLTKVRLAVDFVRDPNLMYIPEPSTALLLAAGLAGLAARARIGRQPRTVAAAFLSCALAVLCPGTSLAAEAGRAAPSAEAVRPLAVGEHAPAVKVRDLDGRDVALASLWGEKPIVLVFYRGGW